MNASVQCALRCGAFTLASNAARGIVLGLFLAVGLTIFCSGKASSAVDDAFPKCIDGSIVDADAIKLGQALASHYGHLYFDASIFSNECKTKIAQGLFQKFDEIASLQLVRYFWNDQFLAKLREASGQSGRSCNMACLLIIDRRPLPSESMFRALIGDASLLTTNEGRFLLARSLVIDKYVAGQLMGLVNAIPDGPSKRDVLLYFYLLQDPPFIRANFRQAAAQNDVCLQSYCIEFPTRPDAVNCQELEKEFRAMDGLEGAATLKFTLLRSDHKVLYSCIAGDAGTTLLSWLFELGMFSLNLDLTDVVEGYRYGSFKSFDFAERDIGLLQNIDFGKFRAISTTSAASLVHQLEQTSDSASFLRNFNTSVSFLFQGTESGARFQLLMCKFKNPTADQSCDRRQIYLEMIKQSYE